MPHSCHSAAARSWLFAPGDAERKMRKAIEGNADIVLLDLEDAVAIPQKEAARTLVREMIAAYPAQRQRIWVRINPLEGTDVQGPGAALRDLAAVMPAAPGGILLPKASRRRDAETMVHYLDALEATHALAPGSTALAALVTETAQGLFHCGDYGGINRLAALSWGAEDLADALGASANTGPDGAYTFPYQMARSFCLMGAASAGVLAIETICADYTDLTALRARARQARRDGFGAMLAIHPAQVPVINAAFTPGEDEIAEAQAIVDLFAAHPNQGAIGWKGGMIDRPWLTRAERLLRRAEQIRCP